MRSSLVIALVATAGPAHADSSVTFGTPVVQGALDAKAVRSVVVPSQPSLAACYHRTRATTAGRAVAKFTIDAEGKVVDATVSGVAKELEACVLGVVGALVFARPANKKPVTVSYPIAFTAPTYGTVGHGGGVGDGARRRVAIGAPDSAGSLDRAVIRRFVKRERGRLEHCYEQALARKPALEGIATARFTIGTDGAVTAATTTGLGDAPLEECFTRALRAVAFPKPPDGKPIAVRHPFTLRAADR